MIQIASATATPPSPAESATPEPATAPPLALAQRRAIAVLAGCSERTVRRWATGRGVHATQRTRLHTAARSLRLDPIAIEAGK